ncbi:head GIN domain-containing protein [Pedobacter gandavensis]|uniref:head GIN domain-containing protein n=1 Tax=Pedobacter gandavensis TaxID=2679963 RepID=UPI00292F30F3|nr:head GIN domain-containing protein [Pedobacter gandavensis]
MKSTFLFKTALPVLLAFSLNTITAKAQQNKNIALTNFSEVTVSSGIDLYLTQSNSENIKVSASKELLENVVIEKSGASLNIKYKDNQGWGRKFKGQSIKVYVNYKNLTSITASGGSDVFGQNTLKTPKLNLRVSGGSDVTLDILADDLQVTTSGGADAKLKGKVKNMIVQTSGGSDVDAYELISDYAKVTASGGSDANVYVNKGLEASASGGSDINYKGDAALNKTSSSKSGDVTHIK